MPALVTPPEGMPNNLSKRGSQLANSATFWHWPAHRRPAEGKSRSAPHAKIIAADTAIALISSADRTDRALSTNLEEGNQSGIPV
jgi:putative cardiolipin synthase